VIVKFSGGKEVYLTPNGASPRLADLWMTAPVTGADLSGAELNSVMMTGVDMLGTKLLGIKCDKITLQGLSQAKLDGAIMSDDLLASLETLRGINDHR